MRRSSIQGWQMFRAESCHLYARPALAALIAAIGLTLFSPGGKDSVIYGGQAGMYWLSRNWNFWPRIIYTASRVRG